MKHFSYTNVMAVPKLEKIVINMGLGEAVANAKIMDVAVDELGRIAGQRPVITRAKKSIANFKLRQNMPIGAAVTLRGERMFEFLDRLTSVVLPRVRDFRGVSMKSFDGRGNYTLGLRDQLIFPEISYEKVDKIRGMNVTIVTTARTDDEARELLQATRNAVQAAIERRSEWLELRPLPRKQRRKKFAVRYHSRCKRCGRPRGFFEKVPALPNLFPAVVALGRSSRASSNRAGRPS